MANVQCDIVVEPGYEFHEAIHGESGEASALQIGDARLIDAEENGDFPLGESLDDRHDLPGKLVLEGRNGIGSNTLGQVRSVVPATGMCVTLLLHTPSESRA